MGTQQVERVFTAEDECRSKDAIIRALITKLGGGPVNIDSFDLALHMMYPRKIDIRCQMSSGTFIVSVGEL